MRETDGLFCFVLSLYLETFKSIVSELHSLYSHGKSSTFSARYSKERNASPISIICRKNFSVPLRLFCFSPNGLASNYRDIYLLVQF